MRHVQLAFVVDRARQKTEEEVRAAPLKDSLALRGWFVMACRALGLVCVVCVCV